MESGDHLKTTTYAPPAKRSKGVMVKDAAELVSLADQSLYKSKHGGRNRVSF